MQRGHSPGEESCDVRELLLRCKEGDLGAFDTLHTCYAEKFNRAAKKKGLSCADADDAVQNTFEKILNGIATYNPNRGAEGWLWTIHYHVIRDHFRALKRNPTEPIHDPEDPPPLRRRRGKRTESFVDWVEEAERAAQKDKEERCQDVAFNRISDEDLKDLRHRGRGPGRKKWHEAKQRFLNVYHQCLEGRL